MSRGSGKAQRLLEMERLYYQRGYTDIEMAKKLGVDRTVVFRYRRELKNEMDVPIIKDKDGRWRIERMRYVSSVRLNRYEALVLYLAARRASQQGRLAQEHVARALEKLAVALRQPMTEHLVKTADAILRRKVDAERVKLVERIVEGWIENRKLRITYQGLHSSRPYRDVVSPYLIEPSPWSDSVYLIGYSEVFDDVAVFKLDRMQEVFVSGETFEVPEDFDEETMLRHAWGVWTREGEPQTVRLKFAPGPATRRLKESTWHPLEKVTDTEDGGCIWEAPIAEWREMLPWIRQWGADCEVLAPEELKETLMGEAKAMAERYGWFVSSRRRDEQSPPTLEDTFNDFFGN